jgi:D-glycero-D-manno-heptose 1,7-bisphosphate phosphatase
MKKAVFLDRDGVINRKPPEGEYVTRWEDLELLPGVPEAIAALIKARFLVIVVSNQRCVAKGLLTMRELDSIHQRMRDRLAAAGAVITEVYYCPHDAQPPCVCRKPAPGMLFTAARNHEVDLAGSWMVGDADTDVEAGKKAGCRTARILKVGETTRGGADVFAQSLLDAVRQILPMTTPLKQVSTK